MDAHRIPKIHLLPHKFPKLELIVFSSGAVVMILELAGSRVLAPYLGTSLFVWTSLIGIILGSLSLGYFWGGKLADKQATYKQFSTIMFIAAIFIAISAFGKTGILEFLSQNLKNIRLSSVLSSIILFSPASIFLGMVSPYAVKLKLQNIKTSGRTVGNLYAISTIGSIVGTFLAGFFLISLFGNTKLLILLSIITLLASILAFTENFAKSKILLICLLGGYLGTLYIQDSLLAQAGYIDLDTDYNHATIYNSQDPETGKPTKLLMIGTTANSAMFLDNSEDLVFPYSKFYDLAAHFNPDFKKALILGGGAYSYPKYFLKKFPQASIDVVEIDPKLTGLAKQYFNLKEDPRLTIYHEDGRIFLNKTENKYDVLFGDAFNSYYSIPYQLTTQEATQKIYDHLNENGIAIINIITSIEGPKGQFLRAEYATYKSVFPQVYVFATRYPDQPLTVQNIILVALKNKTQPSFETKDETIKKLLENLHHNPISQDTPILTDDFAPVDQYISEIL